MPKQNKVTSLADIKSLVPEVLAEPPKKVVFQESPRARFLREQHRAGEIASEMWLAGADIEAIDARLSPPRPKFRKGK